MKRKGFLTVLAALFCIVCYAKDRTGYYYKNIGISNGLSQASVTSVVYDAYGSLWIGTRYGLNEYRNHEVRAIEDIGYVGYLFVDGNQNLWVATMNDLLLYDYASDAFDRKVEGRILCALQTDDSIYFGGENMLLLYRDGNFTSIDTGSSYIIGLYEYGDGIIAVDKGKGLFVYDGTGMSKVYDRALGGRVVLCSALYGDMMYLSVYRQGFIGLNLKDGTVRSYTTDNSGLSFDIVLSMLMVGDELWIGSDGGGIDAFSPSSGKFRSIYMPSNSVSCLYMDPFGNVWAGTICAGLYGLRPSEILSYASSNSALPYDVIDGFDVAYDGKVLVSTDGGGVCVFDSGTGILSPLPGTAGLKVSSLVELDRNHLLLSIYNMGLRIYDLRTGRMSPFIIENIENNDNEFFYGNCPNLYDLGGGHYCLMANAIYDYDHNSGSFERFVPDDGGSVLDMRICGRGEGVFYGYNPEGVFVLDPASHKVGRLPAVVQSEKIISAAVDGEVVWIGTQNGLYSCGVGEREVRKFETGLFRRVTFLFADSGHNLWIAANNTLFRMSGDRIEIIGENEGVGANEIKNGIQLGDNTLLLGGTDGLLKINLSGNGHREEVDRAVILRNVSVDGHRVDVSSGLLTLKSKYSQFRMEVSLDASDPFERYMYRYDINGKTDYTMDKYDDFLVLPELKDGAYRIKVSYFKSSGVWSEPVELLALKILPPWYRTPGFLVVCLCLLFGGCIYWGGYYYTRRIRVMEENIRELNRDFVAKLDRYIIDNLSDAELDIPSIATYMAMSRSALYAKSKKVLGRGIGEYIDEMRMKEACRLLCETDLSMSDISEKVGYNSQRYFSTRFKQALGQTPREYRSKHKGV